MPDAPISSGNHRSGRAGTALSLPLPCNPNLMHARTLAARVLAGRKVIHFIDNTVALSKAVHGYANEPDMATVTNALHVCDAVLGIGWQAGCLLRVFMLAW